MADETSPASIVERLTREGAAWRTHCASLANITIQLQDLRDVLSITTADLQAWSRREAVLYQQLVNTVQMAVLAAEEKRNV